MWNFRKSTETGIHFPRTSELLYKPRSSVGGDGFKKSARPGLSVPTVKTKENNNRDKGPSKVSGVGTEQMPDTTECSQCLPPFISYTQLL